MNFICGPYTGPNTPAGEALPLHQLSCFNTPTSRVSPSLISGTQGSSPSFLETLISWLLNSSATLGFQTILWAPQWAASPTFGLFGLWWVWDCLWLNLSLLLVTFYSIWLISSVHISVLAYISVSSLLQAFFKFIQVLISFNIQPVKLIGFHSAYF